MKHVMSNAELRLAIAQTAEAYRLGFSNGGKLQASLREHMEELQKVEIERARAMLAASNQEGRE